MWEGEGGTSPESRLFVDLPVTFGLMLRHEPVGAAPVRWVRVCRRQDIPPGRGWPVRVGGLRLAVFDTDSGVRAVENRCRHVGNPIDDGATSDNVVICPWHGWRYDLDTGEHLTVFGRRPGLRVFPVRVEGDDVLVEVDEP